MREIRDVEKRNMKNNAVAIGRVISMFLIMLCHIFSWYGIAPLAQLFNVGVEMFFLLSGYLYSNREIKNKKEFLKKRWYKLCAPMYVIMIWVLLANIFLFNDYNGVTAIPIYLLNLQGIGFIFPKIQLSTIPALGPLWFITVIMWSYILMIIVKKYEKDEFWLNKSSLKKCLLLLTIIGCILSVVGVRISYFVVYFIGYAFGKRKMKRNMNEYSQITLFMMIGISIRLISKYLLDGTILYNNIVMITHSILAIWIFVSINYTYEKKKDILNIMCEMNWWKYLETHSLMIYMTHYIFLTANFNVKHLNTNITMKLVVFFVCTFISATMMSIIMKRIHNIFRKSKDERNKDVVM